MGHFNEYINPVKKWSADTLLVSGNQTGRAGALSERITIVATGAGVHCPYQHKVGREGYTALGQYITISTYIQSDFLYY
jgi:hypothetical protein